MIPALLRGLLVPLLLVSAAAAAEIQVSLITVSPGKASWQAFGHNALWVTDTGSGREAVYNFGIFDFAAPNFVLNFVRGRMLYQLAAIRPDYSLRSYIAEQRRVVLHPLNLSAVEKQRLLDHLRWHERPENATYRYHYFLENCSTKVRDALDIALNGELREALAERATTDTFRSSANRYAAALPWMHVGINMALGRPVDEPLSEWERAYLPDSLLASISAALPGRLGPGQELTPGETEPVSGWSAAVWIILLVAAALALAVLFRWPWARTAWAVVSGIAGLVLAAIWLATDHESAAGNVSILLFTPLLTLLAVPRLRRPGLLLACAACVLAGAVLASDPVNRALGAFQLVLLAVVAGRNAGTAAPPAGNA